MVFAGKLGELGTFYVLGQITPLRDVDGAIAGTMQDKGWHRDHGQDVPHVDGDVHAKEGDYGARTGTETQVFGPPISELRIMSHRRSPVVDQALPSAFSILRAVIPIARLAWVHKGGPAPKPVSRCCHRVSAPRRDMLRRTASSSGRL